jgi:hypothetical protein
MCGVHHRRQQLGSIEWLWARSYGMRAARAQHRHVGSARHSNDSTQSHSQQYTSSRSSDTPSRVLVQRGHRAVRCCRRSAMLCLCCACARVSKGAFSLFDASFATDAALASCSSGPLDAAARAVQIDSRDRAGHISPTNTLIHSLSQSVETILCYCLASSVSVNVDVWHWFSSRYWCFESEMVGV